MTKFGVAQPVRRVEDARLLLGHGRYTDDIAPADALFGFVLRSPYAAAKLLSVDTAAALELPGVKAVYTAADLAADQIGGLPCVVPLENRDGSSRAEPPHPVLAAGFVRHVGDPVAFIVATSAQAARDAAEAVLVDYDGLRSVTDMQAAIEPGAPLVWPESANNIAFDWHTGDKEKTDALFAGAAHVTRLTLVNNRIIVNSMEARTAFATYEDGRWTLTTTSQGGWSLKEMLAAHVFKEPEDKFRIVTPDVGGGFGMKLFLYAEHVLVCYAARKLGAPVRWTSDRGEAFLSDTHGRDQISQGELALDAEGKFLGMRIRTLAGMGAYFSNYAPMIPTLAGSKVLASVYDFQAIYVNVLGIFTHTVPVDAYRGAGRPESNYLVERLIDAAANEVGIDRASLRRRNMVPASAMPYVSAMGQKYDSGDFTRVLDAALDAADWNGFPARQQAAVAAGARRGIGLAYYLEATGGSESERAEIRFAADGYVDVYVGTQSSGQGHETAYVQLTAAQLGVDGAKIRIHQGDTDTIPTGGGTGGARSLYSEGQALRVTGMSVIEKGRRQAGEYLEAAEADIVFAEGRFSVAGTDRAVDIITLAAQKPGALDAAEIAAINAHTFPNGCHIAEVEVDPETGVARVVGYVVMDDVGKAVNPMIVRGQVHGGVVQGVGQAIYERVAYDAESGQLVSGSLMDYALPRADDVPDIKVDFIEIPCASNPLGVKGAGEAGAVGSPPAVVNAIIDALKQDGVTAVDMPATPESLWAAINKARAA
ncbi:xanthine dehydrogenase family protein molybdopterin-binding subunit [Acidocella sp.]|jgi:carbon-monoxide dehydrogenase large subunit|uniref:xanthine dehydrogenase family protein molybdopterin-binding subunit n=1 Tax=Acidocella sp. TaxID=50710 RepID=UPI002F3E74F7